MTVLIKCYFIKIISAQMNVAAMQYMFNTVVIDEKSSENLLNWLAKLIWLSHFDFFVLEKGDSASGIVSYSLIPYCIVKKLRNPRLYQLWMVNVTCHKCICSGLFLFLHRGQFSGRLHQPDHRFLVQNHCKGG